VQQEYAVGDVDHLDPAQTANPGDNLLLVIRVAGPHRDVARHGFGVGGHYVHSANVAAVFPDGVDNAGQCADPVRVCQPHGETVTD